MGYRLLVAICVVVMLGGCSAFDSKQGENYEGFSADEVPDLPGAVQEGPYSGYYEGTATLDSNECATVAEAAGTTENISLEVKHLNNTINITFEDATVSAGELEGDTSTFMIDDNGVRSIYYLTFTDETLTGSCEVIERNADGEYDQPCASYTIDTVKGEEPPETIGPTEDFEEETADEDDSDEEDKDEETSVLGLQLK